MASSLGSGGWEGEEGVECLARGGLTGATGLDSDSPTDSLTGLTGLGSVGGSAWGVLAGATGLTGVGSARGGLAGATGLTGFERSANSLDGVLTGFAASTRDALCGLGGIESELTRLTAFFLTGGGCGRS